MKAQHRIAILISILALGALLRGLYLTEIVHNPEFDMPSLDAGYHDYWARALITGDWTPPQHSSDPQIESTPFFRPPGYPHFLTLVYLVTGSSYVGARVLQMLLGIASCLLAYRFARKWFGDRVALLLAGMMSIYWVFIYFEGELLEPVLLVGFGLAAMHLLSLLTERTTFARALAAGLLVGLFAVVRPNILLFAVAVPVWMWWLARRREDMRPLQAAILAFALGAVLMVAPVTVRNYLVADDFVLISSNAGVNLFLGNNPYADGYTAATPGVERWTCYDYPKIVEDIENQLGRPLKHSEASNHFAGMAVRYAVSHPLRTLELLVKKTLLFWGPKEVSNEKEDEFERLNSRILRNTPGNFALVLALAIVGAVMLVPAHKGRRREKAEPVSSDQRQYEVCVLILLLIGTYSASYLPFFVAGRYRVPIIPYLLLFGAYGIDQIRQSIADRNLRETRYWALVLVAAYVFCAINYSHYRPDLAHWHYARATRYDRKEMTNEAISEYRKALEVRPRFVEAMSNLGLALIKQGKIQEAKDLFNRALEIDPNYQPALDNLAYAETLSHP